jgi:hypothetical protein
MFRSDMLPVCTHESVIANTSKAEPNVPQTYSAPQVMLIGSARDLVQGGFRGNRYDFNHGWQFYG